MFDTVASVTLVDRWDLTDFVEAIGEVRMKGFHVFRGQYLRLHSTDGKMGAIGRPEVASRQFVRFRRRRESTH